MTGVPPLPRYTPSRIFQMRDQIVVALRTWAHITVGRGDVQRLVRDIADVPGIKKIPTPALMSSCEGQVGRQMTPEERLSFAWRLAGNYDALRKGIPALPWRPPGGTEWVPVQALRVDLLPREKDGRHEVVMQILAGTPCPMKITKGFKDVVLWRALREFGYTRRGGPLPASDISELTSLRFMVLLDPLKCRSNLPDFFEMRCPSGMKAYNQQIIKLRRRYKGLECPFAFTHDCHRCTIGYRECPAATHRETYVTRMCFQCGQDALVDPESSETTCLECHQKNRKTKDESGLPVKG